LFDDFDSPGHTPCDPCPSPRGMRGASAASRPSSDVPNPQRVRGRRRHPAGRGGMTKVTKRARRTDNAPPTARERHRPRWVPVLSSGIVLAVALHAGLFAFAPLIGIDHPFGYRLHSAPMQLVELSPAKAESL